MINFPETVKINGASISPNYSYWFDQKDNNWVRINLATSLDNIKKAVKNIKEYIKKR